jgi:YNFM family putative membrane transporter
VALKVSSDPNFLDPWKAAAGILRRIYSVVRKEKFELDFILVDHRAKLFVHVCSSCIFLMLRRDDEIILSDYLHFAIILSSHNRDLTNRDMLRLPQIRLGSTMTTNSRLPIQLLVFSLVAASFTTVYITQPVLPVIENEFGINARTASLSVSMVILGIALANLPFGRLADQYPIKPIILVGGTVIAGASLVCAITDHIVLLIAARFIQGLFIPSLTTCVAAYLAQSMPAERLNVVMGAYVSATVAGGLGGRLLGGWIHPALHWRYAFVSATVLLIATTLSAFLWLPEENPEDKTRAPKTGFLELLVQPGLLRLLVVPFGAFFVFSSIFNYLPFYLSEPPVSARTEVITFMYLPYLIGIVMGPIAGRLSNRMGSGATMAIGSLVFAVAIAATLIQSLAVIAASLVVICAGFSSIHAAAVGLLNRRLTSSRGRANSLYVLCYYAGGAAGITACGYAYSSYGWPGAATLGGAVLLLPLSVGLTEIAQERKWQANRG